MKTLMLALLMFLTLPALADTILTSDGRAITGTGFTTVRPGTPFGIFDASFISLAGAASQTSTITTDGFSGIMRAAMDGADTTEFRANFGVSFVLQEARAYSFHIAMTSHSQSGLSDGFYLTTLDSVFFEAGYMEPGILSFDRSGILSAGEHRFSISNDVSHAIFTKPARADIGTEFSFALSPVDVPEPERAALLLVLGSFVLFALLQRL